MGGVTKYSNGFFLSVNFGRSIYSSWRNASGIIKKPVQAYNSKLKRFFEFFFKELSRIEVLCEHGVFGINLFTFTVIFLQILIFFIKTLIQNKFYATK